ncbi:hypothetical protein J8137_08905 [Lactiplantibacillus plantarum]|nr:hypothetical protein [Lactiplantibacillus plantarum]
MLKLKKISTSIWPYLLIFITSIIIISPQLINHSTIIGSDALFHFNRFYDAAKQIQTGNFSYFQTNFGFQQSGRLINGMYGPLFAYMNGLLLLATHSWFNYEMASNLILFMVGGCGMYKLTQFLKSSRCVGILITIMFLSSGWMPCWAIGQNMMAWGAAFSPYALIIAIRMVKEPNDAIHIGPLVLIMAIISQIHILSTLMYILLFIPFFIFAWLNTTNKQHLGLQLFKSVGLTLALSANIWGSFLVMYSENYIATPGAFKLAENALSIGFLPGSRNYLNIVLILVLLFQILWVAIHWKKSRVNTFITIIGLIYLWISSVLFPWKIFDILTPKLETTLQFPVRFDIIAYPLLFAGLAISLNQLKSEKKSINFLMYISLMIGAFFLTYGTLIKMVDKSIVYQHAGLNSWVKTKTIATSLHEIQWTTTSKNPGNLLILVDKSHPDYLPIPYPDRQRTKRSSAYEKQIIKPYRYFYHKVTKDGKLILIWNSKHTGKQRIPVITYAETAVYLNGKHLKHYEISNIGAPLVTVKKGINRLSISFRTPLYFKILLILMFIGWVMMIYWLVKIGVSYIGRLQI